MKTAASELDARWSRSAWRPAPTWVGPIRSIYRWQDKVEDAAEHLLIIKTRASLYAALEKRVKQMHPYEVPEIIAVKISAACRSILSWIHESTTGLRNHPARKASTGRPQRAGKR